MTEPLRVDAVDDGRDVRLVLSGELTYATAALLTREVEQVLDPFRPHLVLDVTRMHFCDSVGLSELLRAQRRARILGGTVVLSGVHGCLARVLAITGVEALFTVVGALDHADTGGGRAGELA
jgi:anti-sigma B factor antagonist